MSRIRLFLSLILGSFAWIVPFEKAEAQPAVTIRAAGQGKGRLFLRDGQKVPTNYANAPPLEPLALASADYDEDGIPDIASGFAAPDGTGVVIVHRGNVDALWPYGDALRHGEPPAFLPDARVFTLPEAPDFLGAGDFDADGHRDIVAARRGGKALYLLCGDGHGGFAEAERIALPGAVTALTTGEIDRLDGLTDIAVGVTSDNGPLVLVFESPAGALRGEPELFPIPAAAAALAMMPLDDDPWIDLAVGAGNELVVIHGRDRRLSGTKAARANVPAASIGRQTLPFAVLALAAGRFTGAAAHVLDLAALGDDGKLHFLERADAEYQAALAGMAARHGRPRSTQPLPKKPESRDLVLRGEVVLPSFPAPPSRLVTAHTSLTGADDVILADRSALHVISREPGARSMRLAASLEAVSGAPAAVLPMRMTPSALHGLVVLQRGQAEPSVLLPRVESTFTVTNTQDGGAGPLIPGSLAAAIDAATNTGGTSTIAFNIPLTDPNYDSTTGTFTITPLVSNICGVNGVPCQGLGWLPDGCTIDGYTQTGARSNTLPKGDNAVIKIVISGASAAKGENGLWLFNNSDTVRGLVINGFNNTLSQTQGKGSFSVGGFGIEVDGSDDIVEGNFIGTDSSGATAVPNYVGTGGFGTPATIGGTALQARNVVSGNQYVNFGSAVEAAPNTYFVQGNYLGTDATGTSSVGGGAGVGISGSGTVVGGATTGAGNLISGNQGPGVSLAFAVGNSIYPDSNVLQGNLIGTDATGTAAVPNLSGVTIAEGSQNLVGGTTSAARNVVSGNNWDGIQLEDVAGKNTIQGNYIGLDVYGAKGLPNIGNGIDHGMIDGLLNAVGTLIGGETPGAGNVISGNAFDGLTFGGNTVAGGPVSGATVLGNLIGTDATGSNPVANGLAGIEIIQGGSYIDVGGTDTFAGNLIAFNTTQGILINPAAGNTTSSPGGSNAVTGNSIFSNGAAGVWVESGAENQVSQNSIYSNAGLGIDIDAAGHQANSSCQNSTNGANGLQNAPVLTPAQGGATLISATATDPNGNTSEFSNCAAVANTGSTLNIAGFLNSLPNTAYSIEFFQNASCDASGFGQGKAFLNRIGVTTGSNCIATFGNNADTTTADLGVSLSVTGGYTATAAAPGYALAYHAVIGNNGPGSAAGASLTDTLPGALTFVSATATQGTCSAVGNTIACNLGTLPSGATAAVTINVTLTGVGTISNSVTVSSTTPDPNSANNSATASINSAYFISLFDHISPASVIAGAGAVSVDLYVYNFYSGVTTVTANGSPLTYTDLGAQQCGSPYQPEACEELSVAIPATMTASPNVVNITVTNPTPGGGSSSASFIVYPSAGTVTQFLISGIPNPASQNTAYQMTVTAANASGQAVSGYRGTVNFSSSNLGSFSPPSPYQFTAADAGAHTFTVTFPSAGTGTLTVADAGTSTITGSLNVTVNPVYGPPAHFSEGATPAAVPTGFPFPTPLVLQVFDASYNALPGITVAFTAPTSGASCIFSNGQNSINVVTDANGNATAPIAANLTAGQYEVYAAVGPYSLFFVLTNTTHVPAHIAIYGGDGQSTPVNTSFPTFLAVVVTDAQNNAIGNIPVTFSAPASGASANMSVTTLLTAASAQGFVIAGEARQIPAPVANGISGSYKITATAGGLSVNFSMTNTPGPDPVSYLGANNSTQSAPVYTQFSSPLIAEPFDAGNNCLAQVPITFTAPATGASATLSASQATSDAATCKAQVTALANGIKGSYKITATAPNGASTTFSLTNTAGTTNSLTATGGTPQTTTIDTAFAAALQATLRDPNGNPLSGQVVGFSAPGSGASATLSAASTVTDSTGLAQINATANATAGSYSVTASFGALTATFPLTNAPPTPGSLTARGIDPQSTVAGSPFATALQATVKDTNGNPMSGVTVSFSAPASGASAALSSASAVTNTQGAASVMATANLTLGSYKVTASAGSLSTTFSLGNALGPPASMAAAGGTPQSTAVGAQFPKALQVTVKDVNGNLLSGVPVSFSAPTSGAGATLSGASALTDANGVASVTVTANGTTGTYNVTASVNGVSGSVSFALTNLAFSPCDVNQDRVVNILDVQRVVNEALGVATAANDLNHDGQVNVIDVQIVIDAALGLGCLGS